MLVQSKSGPFFAQRIIRHLTVGMTLSLLLAAGIASADPMPLVIAPVINRVAGTGPGANLWGLSTFLSNPGKVFDYGAGYPADPAHLVNDIYNDTAYTITGMHLEIYGWADDTEEPWNLTPDPLYPATFGTVPAFGIDPTLYGPPESDIFSTITISPDGKTIDFSNGILLPGARFTDIVKSFSVTNPNYAAIHSSFVAVPEIDPSSGGHALTIVIGVLAMIERRRSAKA